ncbi:fluoride efflux transporter CrcB [Nonomuraea gerenzanensis]|uniref:Fluoride-specific ion channel FluC n=1 Tax=Nonomuraea gerenzanensis TaxID=93944 RepID=A0A1M4EF43_9ACTN|nr:fluoride efflux transporter CrcB [Nonomuraea gerenzanensis]UBU09147.1 fluoride efflux transporter CrcB [Nonomuraea gerenzanensis]SBO97535.1 Protein crcB homolog 2 [Nonomuraea gerenzanensis]
MTDRPIDPDVDLHVPAQRAEPLGPVLAAIAAGGALGALARFGAQTALPNGPADFPWATFLVNVSGCLLIGVLMVVITEVRRAHRLVRPFLGVGVLGGYTTFSTYAVDVRRAVAAGAPVTGLVYLAATMLAALAAVAAGMWLTRRAAAWARAAAR